MVQTEVAERLAAKSGSKIYGIPSAKAAWWADLSLGGTISRSIFWPVPNVDSSLVKFHRHQPLGSEVERNLTFTVIDQAFSQRRKMLRSVLADLCGGNSQAESILNTIRIDPTLRGESLTIHDFLKIASALAKK